jgi:hypothetical protein
MEVHAHTHTARKKWTHYLWEFLMLFLAVFCGFLADNQREHYIEHQREIKFIKSLASDLQVDTARLNNIVQQRENRAQLMDSFMLVLNRPDASSFGSDLYYYNSIATRGAAFHFFPVDGTMQQLKNAGNLRLIRKSNVSDSILAYDVASRSYLWLNQEEEEIIETYRSIAEGIFDGRVLNSMRDTDNNVHRVDGNPPLKHDADALFRLNYRIHMLTVFNRSLRRDTRNLLRRATSLLELLQKEYHLK